MKLYDLIGVLPEKTTIGNTEAEIADLEINSKLVREDSLFICLKGTAFDSHSCLSDLEAYGCAAIVCERKLETKIPQIIVPDSRAAMSLLAAQFYGNPAKKLKLIAVSGTNGKTTTCHILRNILAFAGKKAGRSLRRPIPSVCRRSFGTWRMPAWSMWSWRRPRMRFISKSWKDCILKSEFLRT